MHQHHDHADHPHDEAGGKPHKHSHAHSLPGEGGGLRVVVISSLVLAAVAGAELGVAIVSRSAAVLADGLHNLGDVSTTVALAIAFLLSRRAPTRRFPYGYHRGEDLAGLVVLGVIIASAVASGVTSIEHLIHQEPLANVPLALAVAGIGFLGNEAVAQYKTRAGRRLRSVALEADGRHSRIDGLASLAAMGGVAGAASGVPLFDPVAGLVLTLVIAAVAWETGRTVTGRLLDEADASLVAAIERVAGSTPGVVAVREARARWTGRRILAEVTLELPRDETLARAHALGEEVRHRLYHGIDPLTDVIVHLDPAGDETAHDTVSHHVR